MAKQKPRKKVPKELAVINADNCTGCESCLEVCPVDCIDFHEAKMGIKGNQVRIGINAPKDVAVHRAGTRWDVVTERGVESPETAVVRNCLREAVRRDEMRRRKPALINGSQVRFKGLVPEVNQTVVCEQDIAAVFLQAPGTDAFDAG